MKYHGTGGPRSVDEPLDTITSKDRFAGTREDRVKQIGNAVPVMTARALAHGIVSEYARKVPMAA